MNLLFQKINKSDGNISTSNSNLQTFGNSFPKAHIDFVRIFGSTITTVPQMCIWEVEEEEKNQRKSKSIETDKGNENIIRRETSFIEIIERKQEKEKKKSNRIRRLIFLPFLEFLFGWNVLMSWTWKTYTINWFKLIRPVLCFEQTNQNRRKNHIEDKTKNHRKSTCIHDNEWNKYLICYFNCDCDSWLINDRLSRENKIKREKRSKSQFRYIAFSFLYFVDVVRSSKFIYFFSKWQRNACTFKWFQFNSIEKWESWVYVLNSTNEYGIPITLYSSKMKLPGNVSKSNNINWISYLEKYLNILIRQAWHWKNNTVTTDDSKTEHNDINFRKISDENDFENVEITHSIRLNRIELFDIIVISSRRMLYSSSSFIYL